MAVSRTTGAIYLADTRNFRVRRIGSDGVIDTVVGGGQAGFAGDGGPPAAALLAFQMVNDNPEPGGALAIDDQDRLYIADTENQRIRRVDFAADTIETVAGNGTPGFSGDGGPATRRRSPGRATSRWTGRAACSSPTPTTTGCAPWTWRRASSRRSRATGTRASAATGGRPPPPR